ncbi:MAG TPA: hypothetical protein VJM33_02365 [Microthrixaceae bacterium]|nr:hypothetical protein [Microthrixaceae bacterium]
MRRGRGATTACVVAAIAASALVVGGCSRRQGSGGVVAPVVTSTTLPQSGDLNDPTLNEEGPATPQGQSPDQIRANFDRAIAASDFCELIEVMNTSLPDVQDPVAVVDTYAQVAESLEQAASFVPAELEESWVVIVEAADEAAIATARSGGVVNDPALQAAFSTAEFDAASLRLDNYDAEHCGDGLDG